MTTIAILSDGGCVLHTISELLREDYNFSEEFNDIGSGYGQTNTMCKKADLIVLDFPKQLIDYNDFSSITKDFVFLSKAAHHFNKPFMVCKRKSADKSINPLLNSMVSNKEIPTVILYDTFTDFIKKVREEVVRLNL